ncbi:MAG: SRPBCC domain-containing protein [Pseudomonadota bacterium]
MPALLVIIVAVAVFTEKTFHVEKVIAAPPDAIWAVLVDTSRYPDWNPVFVAVAGDYAEGETLTNTVRFPDGSRVDMAATIETLIEHKEIRQTGGVPGLLTFDHQWLLEPVDGGTRVVQHEVDRGLWLWFWDSEWIEPSYADVLDALAERVRARDLPTDTN